MSTSPSGYLMDLPRKLLWVDGLAGAVAGVAVLMLGGWPSRWYRLPRDLLFFIGWANLAYASYSLSLARRLERPESLIVLLVVANLTWSAACLRWVVVFSETGGPGGACDVATSLVPFLPVLFRVLLQHQHQTWRRFLLSSGGFTALWGCCCSTARVAAARMDRFAPG